MVGNELPCCEMAKMEGGRNGGVCAASSPCVFTGISPSPCSLSLSPPPSLPSQTTPSHRDIFVARSWWVAVPEMGQLPPSASLFVNIQQTKAKPPCGYANVWCPAAAHRDANLRQGPTGYERRKWSFDSWTLSVWRGDRGVNGLCSLAVHSVLAALGSKSVWGGCGEKGNASLHHMFPLRMRTLACFKSTEPDMGQIAFAREFLFSV